VESQDSGADETSLSTSAVAGQDDNIWAVETACSKSPCSGEVHVLAHFDVF
jgi:hypothetical protein